MMMCGEFLMLIDTSHNPCLLSGDAHTFTILVCCLAIHTHSHTHTPTNTYARPFSPPMAAAVGTAVQRQQQYQQQQGVAAVTCAVGFGCGVGCNSAEGRRGKGVAAVVVTDSSISSRSIASQLFVAHNCSVYAIAG